MSKSPAMDLVLQFMGKQNTIPTPVPFIRLLGDHAAAAFLAQCLYWGERTEDPEGWFHKTHEQWEEELVLSADQVRRCVRSCGVLVEVKRKGIPARNYYRANKEEIAAALERLAADSQPISRSGETQQQGAGKPGDKPQGNPAAVRGESPQQGVRETQQLITEPTTEPTQNLKDKKHLAADAAACAPTQPEQDTEGQDLQAVTSQAQPPASDCTQDTQATGGEEVPPAARAARPSAARRLMDVWNTCRGPLPEVETLNEGRRKAIKKLLRDCGDDVDRAAAVLADAAREVACDEFWTARRYGFDNLVPGKVFQKAEAWHARPGRPPLTGALPVASAPAARKDWVNHD